MTNHKRCCEIAQAYAKQMRNAGKLVGPAEYQNNPQALKIWQRALYHAGKELSAAITKAEQEQSHCVFGEGCPFNPECPRCCGRLARDAKANARLTATATDFFDEVTRLRADRDALLAILKGIHLAWTRGDIAPSTMAAAAALIAQVEA